MKIINEPDRVILEDAGHVNEDYAKSIILDVTYPGESESIDEFLSLFEIDGHDYLVNDDMYQGYNIMRVIKRKKDDKLFGYQYWHGGGKYGEAYLEDNGEEFGFETEYNQDYTESTAGPYYVFLPVQEIAVKGYDFT